MAKMKAAVVNPKARHGVEITEREIRPLRFNEAFATPICTLPLAITAIKQA